MLTADELCVGFILIVAAFYVVAFGAILAYEGWRKAKQWLLDRAQREYEWQTIQEEIKNGGADYTGIWTSGVKDG